MPIYYVKLKDHVSVESFDEALRAAASGRAPRYMLIDTLPMSGYDPEVRSWFGSTWTKKYPIGALAGISDKMVWRVVGSAVGLAARVPTKIFATVDEGRQWLEEIERRER